MKIFKNIKDFSLIKKYLELITFPGWFIKGNKIINIYIVLRIASKILIISKNYFVFLILFFDDLVILGISLNNSDFFLE